MERISIGLSGHPGTGKSTTSRFLEREYGFRCYEGSSIIRAAALDGGIELKERASFDGYHRYMQRVLGITCLTEIVVNSPHSRVLQSGLRSRPNFNLLRASGGITIATVCPQEICLDRMDKTNPKNPTTSEEYAAALAVEASNDEYGIHTQWCIDNADYRIDTSGTREETYAQLANIMTNLLTNQPSN